MKLCLAVTLLSVWTLLAQTEAPAPVKGVPADTKVATVDGREVTAVELQSILRALAPAQQQMVARSPQQFLQQYGLLHRLSEMAASDGLDKKSPLKEQLEYNRMVGMAQAELMKRSNEMTVAPEEARKYYDANPGRFEQAKVKAIYIPFTSSVPPGKDPVKDNLLTAEQAKEKVNKALAEIRGGADFVKMVKEYSGDPTSAAKDGDFGLIRRNDKLPEAIKNVIFSLKAGEVSEPVRQPNGYYLFRVEELSKQPFGEVEGQVTEELRQAKFNEWMQATQKSIDVKIEDEAFFSSPASAAGAQATKPAP